MGVRCKLMSDILEKTGQRIFPVGGSFKKSLHSASAQSADGPTGRARPLVESPVGVFAGDGAPESAFIQGVPVRLRHRPIRPPGPAERPRQRAPTKGSLTLLLNDSRFARRGCFASHLLKIHPPGCKTIPSCIPIRNFMGSGMQIDRFLQTHPEFR